jgi:hypothetical protein
MNKTLALIDALEQRLALIVGAAAVTYSALAPHQLSAKWAAILGTAAVVAHVISPNSPTASAPSAVEAPVVVPAPTEAQVNAELP